MWGAGNFSTTKGEFPNKMQKKERSISSDSNTRFWNFGHKILLRPIASCQGNTGRFFYTFKIDFFGRKNRLFII